MAMVAVLLLALVAAVAVSATEVFVAAPGVIAPEQPFVIGGNFPSATVKEMVGPYKLLKSGTIDLANGYITLPLYRGYLASNPSYNIWYVITDSSDEGNAQNLGINYSGKLSFAGMTRIGTFDARGILMFNTGAVDFSPVRMITPGKKPKYFPPTAAKAGSTGNSTYTPLVRLTNSATIWNAPIIAGNVTAASLRQFCNGIPAKMATAAYKMVHDKVVAICPSASGDGGTITLRLTQGYSGGRPNLYLSFDAADMTVATMEAATFAFALSNQDTGGSDNDFGSAALKLFTTINGFTNMDVNPTKAKGHTEGIHPLRQGLNSALVDGRSPLNILATIPTIGFDYSPLWDLNIGEWTSYAINSSYRTRITDQFTYGGFVARGYITGPGGATWPGRAGLVNCPIVYRFL